MVRSGELYEGGELLLETPRLIEEALASGCRITCFLVTPGAAKTFENLQEKFLPAAPVYVVSPRLLQTLSTVETPPGILALAETRKWRLGDLRATMPVILVLAGIQDPGNAGTILRAAEAFGATGVVMDPHTVSPYNAKVVRAAAGSLFRLPVVRGISPSEIARWLRQENIPLVATSPSKGRAPWLVELRPPLAIAFGSEGRGLPDELLSAHSTVTIPIDRRVESLNVASSAAIILYEVARQRALGALNRGPAAAAGLGR